MAEIIMPKVGDAMTEGKVVRWYKKAGDTVKKGEPVAEIETDKVNMDLEADDPGVIDQVLAEEGATVEVGKPLAIVRAEGEAPSARRKPEAAPKDEPKEPAAPKETEKPAAAPVPEATERPGAPAAQKAVGPERTAGGQATPARTKSSPLARRMAREMGVELSAIPGSGPQGRIIAADIERAAKDGVSSRPSSAPAAARPAMPPPKPLEGKDIPLTSMRKTIARRLAESIGPVPHFFLTIEADVTSLMNVREQLNEIHGTKVSINDFVIRACALTLLRHPIVNSSFGPESIRQHGEVHIGIAVATPEGLITPVVRNADRKGVVDIAAEVRALAERARNRKLMPDDYQGSTFTISNLGMFGIEEFTAIINPPNSAIVAVGAAMAKPVVVDGQVVVRDRMRITMSCDHRVIDGATGAQFLQTLQQMMEQPLRLVV